MMAREISFRVGEQNFQAQEWGQAGQLPVIALHGWLDNSASFDAMAPHLQGVHLVALDMAGHGRSDHRSANRPYNIWEDVAEVFAIADQLGWQNFACLGHSRGCMTSMLMAGCFPQRITHLALIDGLWPQPLSADEAPRQLARSIEQVSRRQAGRVPCYSDRESAIRRRMQGGNPLSYEAASALLKRGLRAADEGGGYYLTTDPRLMAASAVKLSWEQITAFMKAIQAPIRLVLADDGIVKMFADFPRALAEFPEVQLQPMSGGHHLHMEDKAQDIGVLFSQFLSR